MQEPSLLKSPKKRKTRAEYYQQNKQWYLDYYQKNKEKYTQYYKDNKDHRNQLRKNNREANPEKAKLESSIYSSRLRKQTPKWADKNRLKDIYIQAKKENLTVDHIIPLKGKNVSGLHVPENLQLLTKSENCRKYNREIYLD